MRPRSLWGQIGMVLFQPGAFFRTFPAPGQSRHWLWVAALVLALVGLGAVRYDACSTAEATSIPDPSFTDSPAIDEFGAFPPDGPMMSPESTATQTANISDTWTVALQASSGVIVEWFVLALLLCEVSLLRFKMPHLGRNLQIAIWTSVPLALMAGLQLVYYAAGGTVGEPGLSGLLDELSGFNELTETTQDLLRAFASRLTLFWLWSLVLIYTGARQALRGKQWAVVLMLAVWIAFLVVAPLAADKFNETVNLGSTIDQPVDEFPQDIPPNIPDQVETSPDFAPVP
jgi:hypothetical protein